MQILSAIMILALGTVHSHAQEKPAEQASSMCPAHAQQKPPAEERRHQGVVERGDQEMGFSHEKTTHHFRLYADLLCRKMRCEQEKL